MSINATEQDWDAVVKRYYDNRPIPKDLKAAHTPDPVNQPEHYRVGEVEAIDYIAQQLGGGVKDYLLGNVHKYLHRHQFKGSALQDLKKTEWYLRKLILEHEQGG